MPKSPVIQQTSADEARCVRADAKRNDEKLLEAAKAAFLERGIECSLEEIARRAGVGIGTLYRHFPTRQHLVEAAVQDSMRELIESGQSLHDAADPMDALSGWMRSLVEHSTAYSGLAKSMAVALCGSEAASTSGCSQMKAAAAELLVRCQESGSIREDVTVDDLLMMLNALAWTADQSSSARSDTLFAVMLDGLRR